MRRILIVLPLLAAQPVMAETAPAAPPSAPSIEVPPELTNPAMGDRLGKTMQGLTDALLALKVGEVQAAVEGREATPAERKLTVGDLARRDHVDVRREVAEAGPKITQGMKALSDALPAILKALDDACKAI